MIYLRLLSKTGNRLIAIFVIPILLLAGVMAMGQICPGSDNIPNQDWRDVSNNLCQTFTYLSNLIGEFVNKV